MINLMKLSFIVTVTVLQQNLQQAISQVIFIPNCCLKALVY